MTLPLGQRTARTQCTRESIRTGARIQPFSTRGMCKFLNESGTGVTATRSGLASVVVNRDRGHWDRIVRQIAGIARGGHDLVDDIHALRDHPEERVALGELAGQVLVADEELAAVRVRPGVCHGQRGARVVALDGLVLELVARPAGPDATLVARRL